MSVSITTINNSTTFGQWRDTTNLLIGAVGKAATLGDPGTSNVGNLNLNGNLTLNQNSIISADKIQKTSNGSEVEIDSNADIHGTLFINQLSSAQDTADETAKIQFTEGSGESDTWFIKTNEDHSKLRIGLGTSVIVDISTDGSITSSGSTPATINSNMLTGGIVGVSLGAGDVANRSTGSFTALVASGGGASVIDNVPIGTNTASSAKFTTVDVAGGSGSEIDNTAIGANTASTGAFTTLTATSYTGDVFGNVRDPNALNNPIRLNATTGELDGNASGLTDAGLNQVLNVVYPVGTLYTTVEDVNPGALRSQGGLGIGDWSRYGEGKVLVGYDDGDTIATLVLLGGKLKTIKVTLQSAHVNKTDGATDTQRDNRVPYAVGDKVDFRISSTAGDSSTIQSGFNIPMNTTGTVTAISGETMHIELAGNVIGSAQVSDTAISHSNVRMRNERFGEVENTGGNSQQSLGVENLPDHIHDFKDFVGHDYWTYNDSNDDSFNGEIAKSGSGIENHSIWENSGTGDDAHRNYYTGGVHGYLNRVPNNSTPGGGPVEVDEVDKPHNNLQPYQVVYIWKRYN